MLILLVSLFVLLQIPTVQTFLGKKASAYLSKQLNTKIDIKEVNIDFFKTINLQGIYVQDQHGDTLLYGGSIGCSIKHYSLKQKQLEIDITELQNITAKLQYYPNEKDMNFQFLVDYFSAPKKNKNDTTPSDFKLGYGNLHLKNVRFIYKDCDNHYIPKYGMDYQNIEVNHIYAQFSKIQFLGDTIKVRIENLSAQERSGFCIKKMNTDATICEKYIKTDNLFLNTPNSYLHGSYYMLTQSFDDYNHYVHKVLMKGHFTDSSYIGLNDIAFFAEEIQGLNEKVHINGDIYGTIADLRSENIALSFLKNSSFQGKMRLTDLDDINKANIVLEAKKLTTTYHDLKQIPMYPFTNGEKILIPDNVAKLGLIHFSGKAQGLINDLKIEGDINTKLGKISAQAKLDNFSPQYMTYGGVFKTENFDVGTFFDAKNIGTISLNANINGKGTELDNLEENIDGKIMSVQFNNYTYKNISINGDIKNRQFNGSLNVQDSNANFSFLGNIDYSHKIPQAHFAANIHTFDLYKCHLQKIDSINVVSGKVDLSMKGSNIDDVNGVLNAEHIVCKKSNGTILVDNVSASVVQNANSNSLQLISSIADVYVDGAFKLSHLPVSINDFLNDYYPTFFPEPKKNKKEKPIYDSLTIKVRIKKFTPIATYFKLPLHISPNTGLQAQFNSKNNGLKISGFSDEINYSKTPIKEWNLAAYTGEKHKIYFNTGFKRINLTDSVFIENFNFNGKSENDKTDFLLAWSNQSGYKNTGNMGGNLSFTKTKLDVDIDTLALYVRDSLWQITHNDTVSIDTSGLINFRNLVFSNSHQQIKVAGKISENPKDQLLVELQNFKLAQLNPLLAGSDVALDGALSGTVSLADIYKQFIFTSALEFKKLKISNSPIGSGEINSFFDKKKNTVSLNGFFNREIGKISEQNFNNIYFDGYYYPSAKDTALNIDAHLYQFGLSALQPFVKDIFTIKEGTATGTVNLKGNFKNPKINGKVHLEDVKNFMIDYLNTSYEVTGDVNLYPDQIEFPNIVLTDIYKNKAELSGNIFHTNFNKMKLDFDVNMKKIMALNTTSKQNNLFYGKAFGTGSVGIYGTPQLLNFDINAKTEKGTQFIIPMVTQSEVSDEGYIRFVKIDTTKQDSIKNNLSGINLNFNLEATPGAEVQLIMDPKGGDGIKARGKGNIMMSINTNGNFEMYGLYTLTEGEYLFTLQNVINKKFDIDEGSNIRWSGNPYNADINVAATYKQRASLSPFFPESSSGSNSNSSGGSDNNKRYAVNCKLFLKNSLTNPDINFGIEFPTLSEAMRSQVMGYINTDQELTRQVFSLLLLRSFVTPLSMGAGTIDAGIAAGSNATEMLSNQLSSMLSKFTKSVNVGFNYRPGSAMSNQEMDVALSTQLFNDKLSLDGNLGVNNSMVTKTNTLIGDLNVDYRITRNNKLHIKAFNRSNDNFQIATLGGQFTQGAGILYKEEFNTLSELYQRVFGKKQKNKLDDKTIKP
ncbi:MAG: translocation/assembly module TamB domain-containing protein [Bacteroidetes bacterium]|nr:translocation/assembly module TamB domain-containing protein [Bacteroidota bacterium]